MDQIMDQVMDVWSYGVMDKKFEYMIWISHP